ncbi:MAG: hypothetical protein A2X86_06670 [Bdellovibrionales bacterium GWA2_49_15]|nr:MAG: hypothetical protein A2X86_06670 [Bdellovibrionales bacterium GWA2_49_15]HAZ12044.1 hypothetical protein [Bdellovibrionales bacterium]
MDVSPSAVLKPRVLFDPIYGFIKFTPAEWEIIHGPFYQRLRWVKQLGFSCYVFPGAEHSRFGHSIGVLHNAQKILESCERAVPDKVLFDTNVTSKEIFFHRSVRMAALLHDLGTFCFSHTTEGAYVDFAETTNLKGGKGLPDDHENLGSFIIKNTNYEGGITRILLDNDFDPQLISDLVKGVGPSPLANQILHSEIDCDRMDYLLRDAHYTGLRYGSYDRDYLLYHFRVCKIGEHEVLAIKQNALHCVEDFLMSRYAWYNQVIRSPRGAKYDAIAGKICFYMLEKGLVFRYGQLLEMIEKNPHHFFNFNDNYFLNLVHVSYINGVFDRAPDIKDMASTLLFQKGARALKDNCFSQRLLDPDDQSKNEKIIKRAEEKVLEIKEFLKKNGTKKDWVISDLPKKIITFVKSENNIVKDKVGPNILLERDPVKILDDAGDIKLLAQLDQSIISKLQRSMNYIPNVYCSNSAYELLIKANMVSGMVAGHD